MNKINQLFENNKGRKLLSLYFCAGCPSLDNTGEVIKTMQRRGIDMIEVGIPFSDPLADGPVIQSAATQALKNGMSLKKLFGQLKDIKDEVQIPLVLMGYLNPILHYGIEAFCQSCVESGVSGAIIPDLPFKDYQDIVKPVADKYDLRIIMLITPETSEERIRFTSRHSRLPSRMPLAPSSAVSLSRCSTKATMPTRHSTSFSTHSKDNVYVIFLLF